MNAKGGCLCGAVRFSAEGVDTHVHGCHCSICRRWAGGPVLAAAVAAVEFQGEEHIRRYPSSEWAERGFCAHCGSSLFYRLKEADRYIICMGAFDDQSVLELVGEIYIDEKPPGYAFAGDHPRQTGEEFMQSLSGDSE